MVRRKKPFKACRNCYILVDHDVEECPNCGSRDFSVEWDGLIVVLKPEESRIAKSIGITKPGRYALRVL